MIIIALASALVIGLVMAAIFEALYDMSKDRWRFGLSRKQTTVAWWCLVVLVVFLACPRELILYMPGLAVLAVSHMDLSDRIDGRISVLRILRNVVSANKWYLRKLFQEKEDEDGPTE